MSAPIVLGLLALLTLSAAWACANYVIRIILRFLYPGRAPADHRPEDFGLAKEEFTAETPDRIRLSGWVLHPKSPRGVVILCHPFGLGKAHVLNHAKILVDAGLITVAFDFRSAGESSRPLRRFYDSLWEPLTDLEAVEAWVLERFAGDPVLRDRIALFGLSFGGNMTLAHAGYCAHGHSAMILDSTPLVRHRDYVDKQLERERKKSGVRRIRALLDRIALALITRLSASDALYARAQDCARRLENTRVLVILGEKETFFDRAEAERFVDGFAGPKELWIVPKARHLTNHLLARDYALRTTRFILDSFGESA